MGWQKSIGMGTTSDFLPPPTLHDIAYGKLALEIIPSPWLTYRTAFHFTGRKGTKEAMDCEENCTPFSQSVSKGPLLWERKKGSPIDYRHLPGSSTAPVGIQIAFSSFPYQPLPLRDFKFQPWFQRSQLPVAHLALTPAVWEKGAKRGQETGNITFPSSLVSCNLQVSEMSKWKVEWCWSGHRFTKFQSHEVMSHGFWTHSVSYSIWGTLIQKLLAFDTSFLPIECYKKTQKFRIEVSLKLPHFTFIFILFFSHEESKGNERVNPLEVILKPSISRKMLQ